MACFLDLVAEGRLDLEPLVSAVLPFDDAVGAYERIQRGEQGGVGLLFRYSPNGSLQRRLSTSAPSSRPVPRPVVHLGVIGAGNYATSMLLPHLQNRSDVRLIEVATATGLSATNAQRRFGFERCSTDYRGLLDDEAVDAVVIATRHHAHAAMVCEALRAGKAVFVEKPLAVDSDQMQAILAAVGDSGNDRLMVGFNRRFAPLLVDLKGDFGARRGPMQVRYDVNAGRLEAGSWYAQPEEGSRLVGEGCHFIDTVSWWLDQDPVAVFAAATGDPDDTASTLLYPDGSVATIAYQTGGDSRAPKELLQVTGDRQLARLHNFQRSELWRSGHRQVRRSRSGIDKGQKQELEAFVMAVAEARAMPIPLESLVATTLATFAARRSLASRRLESVASDVQDGADAGRADEEGSRT
jgi:predicted dehydrogenase